MQAGIADLAPTSEIHLISDSDIVCRTNPRTNAAAYAIIIDYIFFAVSFLRIRFANIFLYIAI